MTELIVTEMVGRYGGDLMFFQVAYLWKYGKQADVYGDVLAWRVQRAIPQYVHDFVSSIGTQSNDAVVQKRQDPRK